MTEEMLWGEDATVHPDYYVYVCETCPKDLYNPVTFAQFRKLKALNIQYACDPAWKSDTSEEGKAQNCGITHMARELSYLEAIPN